MSLSKAGLDAEGETSFDRKLARHATLGALDAVYASRAGEVKAIGVAEDLWRAIGGVAPNGVVEGEVILVRLIKRNSKRDGNDLGGNNGQSNNLIGDA